MKIVYIANSILPSKSANSIHVMKMSQAFANNGHKVVLVVPNRYKEQLNNVDDIYDYYNVGKNFEIIFLKYSYIKYIGIVSYSLDVMKTLYKLKPDLVYGRDLYSCFLSSFRYITSFELHAPMDNKIKIFLLDRMSKNIKYRKTIVISNILKNIILKTQKIQNEELYVAHDGADEVDDFDTKIEFIANNKLNVGYVGSLYRGKGMEIIEKIAFSLPNMIFHIVGGRDEDIIYWKNQIKSENVIFHGFVKQKDLGKYMNSFDICLLPNQIEVYIDNKIDKNSNIGEYTSPLKMFEYMSYKKMIVASNIPVLCEVLNSDNSILIDSKDYNEWIKSLKLLVDSKSRETFSNNAYFDFISKYTWNKRAKNILKEINVIKKFRE